MNRRVSLRARVRQWAVSSAEFPLRRAAVWAVALVILVMVGGATMLSASADPQGGGSGPFAAVDVADSKGIRVSQYELSIDVGNVFNPFQLWLGMRLMTVWNFYRVTIALVAYVFDWTLSMTWLNAIVTPLDAAARQIRDQVINPIGLASLMLLISAVVGAVRIVYGKTGRGIWDIVSAAIVAAAVAVLLVSPVSAVTGEPLTKVRNAGLGIAAMIDGKNLADTDINGAPDAAPLTPAPVLVDAFVRPAHGLINYGVNFTDDQKCTPAYDKALKAGPHFDPTGHEQRDAIAACDQALGEYAKKKSIYAASFGMGAFVLSGILVGLTILTACVLLFISVMMLGWSLVKLVITGVIGIGPGDTRGPMVRNALTALTSLLYVGTSTIVLAVILVLIKNAFASDLGNPMARFLLVDVILIGGLVIVIQTWSAHRRGAQSWTDKALARFQQSAPKPTVGARMGHWLKAPAGGEAAKYGGLGGDGYGPGGGGAASPFGVRRMVRPVTHSNAFQLARLGVIAGATGGTGALMLGKATTQVAARVATNSVTGTVASTRSLAGATATGAHWAGIGVRHTADSAQRIHDTYTAVRGGSQRATAGPRVDPWISRAVQARALIHRGTATMAADAALALGPTNSQQAHRAAAPPTAQHRTEDPQRTTQRTIAEQQLTRPPAPRPSSGSPAAPQTIRSGRPDRSPATRPVTGAKQTPGHPSVTLEPASTAAERVQHLVQPIDGTRHPGTDRPMQR